MRTATAAFKERCAAVSKTVARSAFRQGAELFFLNGSTLKPLKTKGDQAILEGTEVTLTQDAAELLNKTFKVDAFEKGLPIGEAKITLNTK